MPARAAVGTWPGTGGPGELQLPAGTGSWRTIGPYGGSTAAPRGADPAGTGRDMNRAGNRKVVPGADFLRRLVGKLWLSNLVAALAAAVVAADAVFAQLLAERTAVVPRCRHTIRGSSTGGSCRRCARPWKASAGPLRRRWTAGAHLQPGRLAARWAGCASRLLGDMTEVHEPRLGGGAQVPRSPSTHSMRSAISRTGSVRRRSAKVEREVNGGDLPPGSGEPDRLSPMPASRVEGKARLHVTDLRKQKSIRRPTRNLLWAFTQGVSPAPFPGILVKRLVRHDTTRSSC